MLDNLIKSTELTAKPRFTKMTLPNMIRLFFRVISFFTLGLAFSSGVLLLVIRAVNYFQPNFIPWTLKSAIPLILVGVAFASLQFATSRTRTQVALGLVVSTAFILWGAEQYLSNPTLVSLIDDIVVFLFVLDLSLVIYGQLKSRSSRPSGELPLDSAGK